MKKQENNISQLCCAIGASYYHQMVLLAKPEFDWPRLEVVSQYRGNRTDYKFTTPTHESRIFSSQQEGFFLDAQVPVEFDRLVEIVVHDLTSDE